MPKTDAWIKKQVSESGMISPFVETKVKDGVLSYGLGPTGYDLRLAYEFVAYKMLLVAPERKPAIAIAGLTPQEEQMRLMQEQIYNQPRPVPLNPKNIPTTRILNVTQEQLTNPETGKIEQIEMQPGMMLLGRSMEYLRIPDNIVAFGYGKSTYARCGILVNITPIEAGWEGHLTIAISNINDMPVLLYPGEGIAQIVFYGCEERPDRTYGDEDGKYQRSSGIVVAKV